MNLFHPIRSDEELDRVHARRHELMFREPPLAPGSAESDELEVLDLLAYDYEQKHIRPLLKAPTALEFIEVRMAEENMTRRDLEKFIGNSGLVSQVLSGKRPLSLAMMHRLHTGLGIPADILLADAAKRFPSKSAKLSRTKRPVRRAAAPAKKKPARVAPELVNEAPAPYGRAKKKKAK